MISNFGKASGQISIKAAGMTITKPSDFKAIFEAGFFYYTLLKKISA
jgi:hypothetical protein